MGVTKLALGLEVRTFRTTANVAMILCSFRNLVFQCTV